MLNRSDDCIKTWWEDKLLFFSMTLVLSNSCKKLLEQRQGFEFNARKFSHLRAYFFFSLKKTHKTRVFVASPLSNLTILTNFWKTRLFFWKFNFCTSIPRLAVLSKAHTWIEHLLVRTSDYIMKLLCKCTLCTMRLALCERVIKCMVYLHFGT